MARKFFPGCKIKACYPEASAELARIVLARGWADEAVGCCRVEHQRLVPSDIAVCLCNNCMAMIEEDAEAVALENLWVIMDHDEGFPLPRYDGRRMAVQDCGRAYDRADVQDAVRSLLGKMGIEVVELPDAREKSRFCGASFLREAPKMDAGFAPKRYVADAAARGIFVPHTDAEIDGLLRAHAETIPTDEVVCYCTACDAGLEQGGAHPVNLLELVTGKFRAR